MTQSQLLKDKKELAQVYTQEKWKSMPHKNLYTKVYNSTTHYSQKLKTNQMSIISSPIDT